MTGAPIRVYAIDEDPQRLQSLALILTSAPFAFVGCSCVADFLSSQSDEDVGCLIVDLHQQGLSSTEILGQLKQAGSALSVIVVAGAADVASTVQVMREGALTVLEKPYTDEALRCELQRGIERSLAAHKQRVQLRTIRQRLATLSSEERDVLTEMTSGTANKVIAQRLAVSMRTVERHRSQVFRKMQVGSIAELARLMSTLD